MFYKKSLSSQQHWNTRGVKFSTGYRFLILTWNRFFLLEGSCSFFDSLQKSFSSLFCICPGNRRYGCLNIWPLPFYFSQKFGYDTHINTHTHRFYSIIYLEKGIYFFIIKCIIWYFNVLHLLILLVRLLIFKATWSVPLCRLCVFS